MSSLLSQYIKELGYKDLVESDKGFILFRIVGNECHIEEIYILPDYRRTGEASRLTDEVTELAKEKGCKALFGFINPETATASLSLTAQLKYGFKPFGVKDTTWVLVKEIQ